MSTDDEIRARFRAWLKDAVWGADDMGGFVTGQTEEQVVANVSLLFDLIDPEWRNFTYAASVSRRGASGGPGGAAVTRHGSDIVACPGCGEPRRVDSWCSSSECAERVAAAQQAEREQRGEQR